VLFRDEKQNVSFPVQDVQCGSRGDGSKLYKTGSGAFGDARSGPG
jgi:hypothetical protein